MEKTEKAAQRPQVGVATRTGTVEVLVALALALAFGYAFFQLAADVRAGDTFLFDRMLMDALQRLSSPWLTATMLLITQSAAGLSTALLASALSAYWWLRVNRRLEAIVLAITLWGSAIVGWALKLAFGRPRPHFIPWLTTAGGWSFPSGHTLNAVVLAGLLAWLVGQRLGRWRRVAFDATIGLWAALVGLSRIYLGVHYPSDVLASVAVGGLCLLAALGVVRLIYTRQRV
jgi:undecaprenyl-diphosphatase